MDLRPCSLSVVAEMVEKFHGYGGMGASGTACFAVYENDEPVAAYSWQPPPPGAAKSVCPEEPGAVLALSRMVAVPREQRQLKHVSKPLRVQMKSLLDRSRWPVLVTYSDFGQGHTGYVYQCSGWTPTKVSERDTYTDATGVRISSYSAGAHRDTSELHKGTTVLQRWESWACPPGSVVSHMAAGGWSRRVIPGKTWRNGSPAHTWVRDAG